MRKLIVTGGGTGGHVYPALSIARGFLKRHPEAVVLYVGGRGGLESQVVPLSGIPFRSLEVEGLLGRGLGAKIRSLWLFTRALVVASGIIGEFAPDCVVGTGGYVSGPVVLRAQLARIPTLVQEQNVFPGLTNRMLSRRARAVAVVGEEAIGHFPDRVAPRIVVTGNPVRSEILTACRRQARERYGLDDDDILLLVFGGSGGAETINTGTVEFILDHLHRHRQLRLMYVTGPRYYRWVGDALDRAPPAVMERVNLIDYLEDMPSALAACDLLLCRGGAMSLAEAAAVGRPMIIVPSPNVPNDEQRHNARALEKAGASVVMRDHRFGGDSLEEVLTDLLDDETTRQRMAEASAAWGRPGALDTILDAVDDIMSRRWVP